MSNESIENKLYCVYMHTSPSNKKYIGITSLTPPSKRWRDGHGYSHNKHFSNAIEKYGWDNFTHEIVAENLTKEEAEKMEVELIEKYNTFNSNDGYNGTSGGEIGKQHSDEVRKNQSKLAKRCWQDEEFRKKQSEFRKSRTGEKNPNYGNHKLAGENNPMYGKHHSEETKEKLRQAALSRSPEVWKRMKEGMRRAMTPERREQIRQQNLGRKASEESRHKMSESQKARWTEDMRKEWGEKFSGENNGMYGKHHSEETRQKISEKVSGENSAWYGRHHTEEEKRKAHDSCTWKVPVVQLSLQGEYIAEYDSYADSAKAVGCSASQIIGCCNGTYLSAKGFIWIRKEDYDHNKKIVYKNNSLKPIVQLTKEWEYVNKYESGRIAEKETGKKHQNICRSCKSMGKALCGGFRWMYEKDYIELIDKTNQNKNI